MYMHLSLLFPKNMHLDRLPFKYYQNPSKSQFGKSWYPKIIFLLKECQFSQDFFLWCVDSQFWKHSWTFFCKNIRTKPALRFSPAETRLTVYRRSAILPTLFSSAGAFRANLFSSTSKMTKSQNPNDNFWNPSKAFEILTIKMLCSKHNSTYRLLINRRGDPR